MSRREWAEYIGKAWTPRGGQTRYYVNDWHEYIGLQVEYYSTGNPMDVKFNGERMSNSYFNKYVSNTKVWIGADDGEVHVDHCGSGAIDKAIREEFEENYRNWCSSHPEAVADAIREEKASREEVMATISRLRDAGFEIFNTGSANQLIGILQAYIAITDEAVSDAVRQDEQERFELSLYDIEEEER